MRANNGGDPKMEQQAMGRIKTLYGIHRQTGATLLPAVWWNIGARGEIVAKSGSAARPNGAASTTRRVCEE